MAIILPYEFDTTGVVKTILRGVLGLLLLVVVPGILYSLFITRNPTATILLLLIGAFTGVFGRIVFRHLEGSAGTITAEAIFVHPVRLYGLQLPGPTGRFPIAQFTTVRVDRISGHTETPQASRGHERVWLVGRAGTPDILIGRTEGEAGVTLARDLGNALQLPWEEAALRK